MLVLEKLFSNYYVKSSFIAYTSCIDLLFVQLSVIIKFHRIQNTGKYVSDYNKLLQLEIPYLHVGFITQQRDL